MSYTAEMYSAILTDIQKGMNTPGKIASRLREYPNGATVVFSIDVMLMRREFYVRLTGHPESIQFPKWHGVFIDIAQLPVYGNSQYYARFVQLPESENYIFDIVVEDLRQALENTDSEESCLPVMLTILAKWKKFFQSEKPIVMSDELQEGLFGELTFLHLLIRYIGTSVVMNWVGGEKETHDFYIRSYAVEVKTTIKKEPYSFRISSEYQLDESDVTGGLYLYGIALRKSKQSGTRIPEMVQRIRDALIGDATMLIQFNDKLLQYGFIDGTEELYTNGFTIRDRFVFKVEDQFPRIIRTMYLQGVSKVSYEILASQCLPFSCTEEKMINQLRGGGQHD